MTALSVWLAIVLTALALADGWTTHQILKAGGRELNPVVKWIMGKLGTLNAIFATRLVIIVVSWVVLARSPQWWWLALLTTWYAWAVVNNLLVLRKAKLL